jgi:hypothetical protein
VRRFDGFVAKYMGDGVLIYFGYPHAHEDDAERAVRAGLEMIASVSALASPISLQTRVGIATGLVVVGDLIGSGSAQERGIVGETPNQAARLRGIAEPNMVVIAESISGAVSMLVLEDPVLLGAKQETIELLSKARLPAIYGVRDYVEAGGLVSYGTDQRQMGRRAAEYVDKILKGTSPANLPVEQPTKFELVINLKAAKALGLEVPPSLLARADEVIE